MVNIQRVQYELAPYKEKLINHKLYNYICSTNDLKVFMEHHIFAVWDFMSLLKVLQSRLTCVNTPWVPTQFSIARRLINAIVLEEESDVNERGETMSHFEMYLGAMIDCGADASEILTFVEKVQGSGLDVAMLSSNLPASVHQFLHFTFEVIKRGKLHEIAAAFTLAEKILFRTCS